MPSLPVPATTGAEGNGSRHGCLSAQSGAHVRLPAGREDNSSDERGRGLDIVTALADYWDIEGDETARVVCARFDWPGVIRDGA